MHSTDNSSCWGQGLLFEKKWIKGTAEFNNFIDDNDVDL